MNRNIYRVLIYFLALKIYNIVDLYRRNHFLKYNLINMNETRKAIIELIEPYMEKTLSEGCLIITWFESDIEEFKEIYKGVHQELNDVKKIIGHYDITAVLKYIGNSSKMKYNCMTFDVYNLHNNLLGEIKIKKPLHLYSEQEEKDLLELLNKLK